MTTTPEPEEAADVAMMDIHRSVSALIVDTATAYPALWSAQRNAVPDDVRVVLECVDQLGRAHHLSLDLRTGVALAKTLTDVAQEAIQQANELS